MEIKMKEEISRIWFNIQGVLFPFLDENLKEPLTEELKKLVSILEIIQIENYVRVPYYWQGLSPKNRIKIARSFVAKAVFNMPTTRALISRLLSDSNFRKICGWERRNSVPSESTFSRAFAEFANNKLGLIIQEELIQVKYKDQIVGHVSRDSTSIEGREKPQKKGLVNKESSNKKKDNEPTRLERQQTMNLKEMLDDLPSQCDVGTKKNSKGYKESWIGYKLHIDAADGQIPISCILSSASVHDSQVAIPLSTMTSSRVNNLYDLMDAAYDSSIIKEHSKSLGHVPIIDINPRSNKKLKEELLAEKKKAKLINIKNPINVRYNERSNVERVNGRLKDDFGGKMIRVKGDAKVMSHLMFGILALTADQLLKLVM